MSAPDHSPSGVPLSPGEELEEEPVALLCIESTITARDSELNSLSRVAVVASNLLEKRWRSKELGEVCSMIFADQAASLKKFYYKLFFGTPCI